MTHSPTTSMQATKAHLALRAAFVARLVRQMTRTGVMTALFSASFDRIGVSISPPRPCASGAHATLKPLCRSGVAAGGAGGGGPGFARTFQSDLCAAVVMPIAA